MRLPGVLKERNHVRPDRTRTRAHPVRIHDISTHHLSRDHQFVCWPSHSPQPPRSNASRDTEAKQIREMASVRAASRVSPVMALSSASACVGSGLSQTKGSQTKVYGTPNQHDIRINLRRIELFALSDLGWRW